MYVDYVYNSCGCLLCGWEGFIRGVLGTGSNENELCMKACQSVILEETDGVAAP